MTWVVERPVAAIHHVHHSDERKAAGSRMASVVSALKSVKHWRQLSTRTENNVSLVAGFLRRTAVTRIFQIRTEWPVARRPYHCDVHGEPHSHSQRVLLHSNVVKTQGRLLWGADLQASSADAKFPAQLKIWLGRSAHGRIVKQTTHASSRDRWLSVGKLR